MRGRRYLNGLAFEDRGIPSPYKFGFIGSSDTHVAATTDDEANYFSKAGLLDSTGELRGSVPLSANERSDALREAELANVKTIDGRDSCSDGGIVDPSAHRRPDNGARVDLTTCSYAADKGDPQIMAVWEDPEFDPERDAFYYARVLENPTCRWSTWDALRAGVPPRPDLHPTIQERAWSSPV